MRTPKSTLIIALLVLLNSSFIFAQLSIFDKQLPQAPKFTEDKVLDPEYGIIRYERLTPLLGGDSVRNDRRGYAAQGWHEDLYENGQLLHRGFYVDGALTIYKNFFDNGQVERNFKVVDLKRCNLIIYYKSGVIKSEVSYYDGNPQRWNDYYPNGKLEYSEDNHKSMEYLIFRKKYFENGSPQMLFELIDSKKKVYTQKEYYENGQLKEEGTLVFNKVAGDYQRDGEWKYYTEAGELKKQEAYIQGTLNISNQN